MSIYNSKFSSQILSSSLLVNDGDGKYPMHWRIMDVIYREMDGMLSIYSRLLVVRFDLHLHEYDPRNTAITKLFKKLRKLVLTKYKSKRLGYVWVREKEKAKAQHYHVMLILDGNKIRYPCNLLKWVETRWENMGNPKPYTPKNCYYFMKRTDNDIIDSCMYRVSYLAKMRGKGYKPKHVRDFSSSRVSIDK